MRWKLLFAFGLGITIIFIAVAGWILRFSTNTANDRVRDTLRGLSVGGAQAVDAEAFAELVTIDPLPTAGDVYPSDAGQLAGSTATAESLYPTDARYWAHIDELVDIRLTNPEASPYSFYEDEDGVVRFVGSWGAPGTAVGLDAPAGAQFRQDALEVLDESARDYLSRGLTGITEQPPYTDTLGSWIAVLTPIRDADGEIVGGLGIDYPLEYVDEVRRNVIRVLYPAFAIAYIILLALVFYLSGWLTKRLARLSSATKRIAEGDYDVDLSTATRSRFPDEMTELASSFIVMTEKVGTRERDLTRQVQILKVEIDEKKRQEAVSEIIDSDFFNDLTSKAQAMRARVKADEAQAAVGGGND
jgi:HAMP domain-containing protein